jgi:hypothetical protein
MTLPLEEANQKIFQCRNFSFEQEVDLLRLRVCSEDLATSVDEMEKEIEVCTYAIQ